ncbi:MAG: hypothetical protein WAO55_06660 [Candidatus Manganitrophaceae bacterium]
MILSPSLKALLQQLHDGVLTTTCDHGQVHLLVKLPHPAIPFLEQPLQIRHFLFLAPMPTAPIVGWFFEIRDDPEIPLRLDLSFNIRDPTQENILTQLPYQTRVLFHFVDGETLTVAATVRLDPPSNAARIYAQAIYRAAKTDKNRYDFKAAQEAFRKQYPLDQIATWDTP